MTLASRWWQLYLKPGAEMEVSLPAGIEKDFMGVATQRGMFDRAMQQARKTLYLDTFPRFEETDEAQALMKLLLGADGGSPPPPPPPPPAPPPPLAPPPAARPSPDAAQQERAAQERAAQGRAAHAEQEHAATKVQAMQRGRLARRQAADAASAAASEAVPVQAKRPHGSAQVVPWGEEEPALNLASRICTHGAR